MHTGPASGEACESLPLQGLVLTGKALNWLSLLLWDRRALTCWPSKRITSQGILGGGEEEPCPLTWCVGPALGPEWQNGGLCLDWSHCAAWAQ